MAQQLLAVDESTGPVLSRLYALDSTAPGRADPAGDHDRVWENELARGVRADVARVGPAATVVSVAGAVDIATAPVLASATAGAVSAGGAGGHTVLKLNRVTFLGAYGLGVILAAHADARRRGGVVALVVDEVAPAARTVGFLPPDRGPVIYSTLTAALHTYTTDPASAVSASDATGATGGIDAAGEVRE